MDYGPVPIMGRASIDAHGRDLHHPNTGAGIGHHRGVNPPNATWRNESYMCRLGAKGRCLW